MEYLIKFADNTPVPAKVKRVGETITALYRFEDTDFLLRIEKNKVVHKALGDGLEVEFVHGKRSVGRLKCGNLSAPYVIFRSYIKVRDVGLNKDITVVFDGEDGRKRVEISLIAINAD